MQELLVESQRLHRVVAHKAPNRPHDLLPRKSIIETTIKTDVTDSLGRISGDTYERKTARL
jgi:hypothetical protein